MEWLNRDDNGKMMGYKWIYLPVNAYITMERSTIVLLMIAKYDEYVMNGKIALEMIEMEELSYDYSGLYYPSYLGDYDNPMEESILNTVHM